MDRHPGGPRAEGRTLVVLYSIFGISVLLALGLFGVTKVRTNSFLKVLAGLGLTSLALGTILETVVFDSRAAFSPSRDAPVAADGGLSIGGDGLSHTWSFFDLDVIVWSFYVGFGLVVLAAALFVLGHVGGWAKPYGVRFARFARTQAVRLINTVKGVRFISIPNNVRAAEKADTSVNVDATPTIALRDERPAQQ